MKLVDSCELDEILVRSEEALSSQSFPKSYSYSDSLEPGQIK
jgi:hypothetical protein